MKKIKNTIIMFIIVTIMLGVNNFIYASSVDDLTDTINGGDGSSGTSNGSSNDDDEFKDLVDTPTTPTTPDPTPDPTPAPTPEPTNNNVASSTYDETSKLPKAGIGDHPTITLILCALFIGIAIFAYVKMKRFDRM